MKRRSRVKYERRAPRHESAALVGEQRVLDFGELSRAARWGGRVKNDGHFGHSALRVERA
ncbi:hypothetical protein ACYX34_13805 [Nitrospira sp. CMX1]